MPLTADIDGARVNTIQMPPSDWTDIYGARKKPDIRCPGCTAKMHPKQLGDLHFFAHNPTGERHTCELALEGEAHIHLKAAIASSASRLGASVDIEHRCEGGRADVVVHYDTKTMVFEAQISPLSAGIATTRTDIYEREIGPVTWVHTGKRQWHRTVPAIQVDDRFTVIAGIHQGMTEDHPLVAPHPVTVAVPKIITGRYMYIHGSEQEEEDRFGWYVDRDSLTTASPTKAKKAAPPHYVGRDTCNVTGIDLRAMGQYANHPRCCYCNMPLVAGQPGAHLVCLRRHQEQTQ